jgi:dinuclear metal center YbgI/SA1388 family protein
MKIKSVISYLESIAPLSLQEVYDNAGLIIGNEEDEVLGALISIDCTEVVVEEAIQKKCNLIISHHPIIFSGLKKITGKNYIERVVLKAIQNNIAIYAIHTNLDNVYQGVNKKICNKLRLNSCKFLLPKTSPFTHSKGEQAAGSGMIGTLYKPIAEKEFLDKVKDIMKAGALRYTGLLGKKVKKVAVCGGSGSFLLNAAIEAKADVFITSDVKYHQFFDADNKIVIADIGHYESEQYTKELIHDMLKRKFSIFALHLSDINTNPVSYL